MMTMMVALMLMMIEGDDDDGDGDDDALPHWVVAKTCRFSRRRAFAASRVAPPGSACGLNGEMAKAAKWRWAAAKHNISAPKVEC